MKMQFKNVAHNIGFIFSAIKEEWNFDRNCFVSAGGYYILDF